MTSPFQGRCNVSNLRSKVTKGLLSLDLCPAGKKLMNESIVGGQGPKLFEPHMAECERCRKEMDRLIDIIANGLGPK